MHRDEIMVRLGQSQEFKRKVATAAGVLFAAATALVWPVLQAEEIALAWDANTEPNVVGYRIYYGISAGSFSSLQDVGNATTASLTNLVAGLTYSFYVTCYNASGLESDPSNVVSYTVPDLGSMPRLSGLQLTAQGMEMQWASNPGAVYRILYKNDFSDATWQVLDEIQAAGSSMYWVDSTASSVPRRFYRVEVLP